MIVRIAWGTAAVAVLFLSVTGTSDGHRNEGKIVMDMFAAEFLLYALLRGLLTQWYLTAWGKLMLIPQLGTAGFFLAMGATAIFAFLRQDRGGADDLMVPGTSLNGDLPSPLLEGRLQAALNYLQRNPYTVCIVSGGQVNDEIQPEAAVMQKWLIEHGVSEERILTEKKSATTLQNFWMTKQILEENGRTSGRIAIATDRFHYLRCALLAKKAGLRETGLVPSTGTLLYSACWYFREILVWVKYLLHGFQ